MRPIRKRSIARTSRTSGTAATTSRSRSPHSMLARFSAEEHRATVEFLLEACGDLPRLRRQDLTWPAEPTRLVLAVERRQARGDPARIRLNVEPIPNPPQADRQAVRDEEEGHRYRESVIRSGP